jgi:hypothetical protein
MEFRTNLATAKWFSMKVVPMGSSFASRRLVSAVRAKLNRASRVAIALDAADRPWWLRDLASLMRQ